MTDPEDSRASFKKRRRQLAEHELQRRWQSWRAANEVSIQRLPFPEVVFESEDRWANFLMHGHFTRFRSFPESYDIHNITPDKAIEALSILERLLERDEYVQYTVPQLLREIGYGNSRIDHNGSFDD